jgi:gas vesicle protein
MSKTNGNTGEVLLSIVAGAAIGVGVGILIAPDKGSKTRKKIKDKFNSSKEGVEEKIEEFMSYLNQKSNDVTSNIDEAFDEAISEDGAKKEELISYLEEKLKALKKASK